MKTNVRAGKEVKRKDKKSIDKSSRYDLFEDKTVTTRSEGAHKPKKQGSPLMTKSERNKLYQSLNTGKGIEISSSGVRNLDDNTEE